MKAYGWMLALVLCAGAACGSFAADGGTLQGSVIFTGAPPNLPPKPVPAADQPACKCNQVADETLLVDPATKGIKWAIVRLLDVKGAGDPPKPEKNPEIDQKGCRFTPRVIIVPPDSIDLNVLNPDKVVHNVHTTPYDFTNPAKNLAQGADEAVKPYKKEWMKDAEIIEVKCDIHPWMKGFIVVHDPRFAAITAADGTFEIKNIPPGKYKLTVFQETLGEKPNGNDKLEVEIKAGETTKVEVKFDPKK